MSHSIPIQGALLEGFNQRFLNARRSGLTLRGRNRPIRIPVAENLQSNNVNGRPLENGVAIIVMGVSGSGKTTLGTLIARAIDANFYDADDYHDAPSVEKMRAGVPLTDQDRAPWLARLNDLLLTNIRAQRRVVLACSALKADYRHAILHDVPNARLILLDGGYETIAARMRKRSATTSHYMPEALLRSQFDTLERPNDAIVIDVGLSCDAQLECALASLK